MQPNTANVPASPSELTGKALGRHYRDSHEDASEKLMEAEAILDFLDLATQDTEAFKQLSFEATTTMLHMLEKHVKAARSILDDVLWPAVCTTAEAAEESDPAYEARALRFHERRAKLDAVREGNSHAA